MDLDSADTNNTITAADRASERFELQRGACAGAARTTVTAVAKARARGVNCDHVNKDQGTGAVDGPCLRGSICIGRGAAARAPVSAQAGPVAAESTTIARESTAAAACAGRHNVICTQTAQQPGDTVNMSDSCAHGALDADSAAHAARAVSDRQRSACVSTAACAHRVNVICARTTQQQGDGDHERLQLWSRARDGQTQRK